MRPRFFVFLLLLFVAVLGLGACGLIDGDSSTSSGDNEPDPNGGTIIIRLETDPPGGAGSVTFTGVPTGTVSLDGTLVVSDLQPGTYTTTEVDPAPGYDVTGVACDDGGSAMPSSGDAGARTAVINLDPGETVPCIFTNTQRGNAVVVSQSNPDGSSGDILFTGVPSGTIPVNGTLVVSHLQPGTYTTTEADPAPEFDVTSVTCDDGGSPTPSSGDAGSRTAVFNIDPGEMVRCTFTNTQRGTLVIESVTDPTTTESEFQFTGVPSGTISTNGTLVVANLQPGTYTSTEVDPAPEYEVSDVSCDDGSSATPSSGDAGTRSAVFNLDPGEMVRCTFTNTGVDGLPSEGSSGSSGSPGDGGDGEEGSSQGINPFEDPDELMEEFPLPDDLPPDAGTYAAPKGGPWSVTHFEGQMDCGVMQLAIPASPPESGVIEVLDGGSTLIATGLEDAQGVSITMNADPEITGRYAGAFEGVQEGIPVTINYFWQVITDEHIVGFLTASVTNQGTTCTVYRPYELFFSG